MDYCSCCGSEIPDEQGICSMCYGDPNFGRDMYYLNIIENEEHQRHYEEEELLRFFEESKFFDTTEDGRIIYPNEMDDLPF